MKRGQFDSRWHLVPGPKQLLKPTKSILVTSFFRPGVESILGQEAVEPAVERILFALGKLLLVDAHRLLLGFASPDRHAAITQL